MNESIATILDQARLFLIDHAPADLLRQTVPFGISCLAAGIVLSVLGAKLSRFMMTSGFMLLGTWIGIYFAEQTGVSKTASALVAAGMLGLIGFQTFRLWVGVLAALVLSTASLSVFGYQKVMPHMQEFQQTVVADSPEGGEGFPVPTPQQQQDYLDRTPQQWVTEFWTYLTQKDDDISRDGRAVVLGSLVTGLCLGVVAVRWALILSTALLGTALVTTASTTLLVSADADLYRSLQQRPGLFGIAVGAMLVSSIVLQTLLTRRPKPDKAGSGAKS